MLVVRTGRRRIIYSFKGSFDSCHLEYEISGVDGKNFSGLRLLPDLRFPLTALSHPCPQAVSTTYNRCCCYESSLKISSPFPVIEELTL